MPKDGPVHDVKWSPAGDYFCVVAGFMPAKVRVGGGALSYAFRSSVTQRRRRLRSMPGPALQALLT